MGPIGPLSLMRLGDALKDLFGDFAVNIDISWSGNGYFRVLRLPKETSGRDLHFGGGHLVKSPF